jgi:purine nucleoside permease
MMVAGVAGLNPEIAATGSITFARYAVQVALQYEFDIRDMPENYTTGYIPQGSSEPDEYPQELYGTEVFEVNANLRELAVSLAKTADLNDSTVAQTYRAQYAASAAFIAGSKGPSVVACDTATSDVYWSGAHLGQAFENTTKLWTNGTGVYCTTQQEDNAILEAIMRADKQNLTDFSRVIIMRAGSDYDRAPPGVPETQHLLYNNQGGYEPALENIYRAGIKVVQGLLASWDTQFVQGVEPTNYVGDILATLGGTPDFGLANQLITKRDVAASEQRGNLRMKRARSVTKRGSFLSR